MKLFLQHQGCVVSTLPRHLQYSTAVTLSVLTAAHVRLQQPQKDSSPSLNALEIKHRPSRVTGSNCTHSATQKSNILELTHYQDN